METSIQPCVFHLTRSKHMDNDIKSKVDQVLLEIKELLISEQSLSISDQLYVMIADLKIEAIKMLQNKEFEVNYETGLGFIKERLNGKITNVDLQKFYQKLNDILNIMISISQNLPINEIVQSQEFIGSLEISSLDNPFFKTVLDIEFLFIVAQMIQQENLELSVNKIIDLTLFVESTAKVFSVSMPEISQKDLNRSKLIAVSKYINEFVKNTELIPFVVYFSEFDYYEMYEEYLTGEIYVKTSNGPVVNKIDYIDIPITLSKKEFEVIDHVIERLAKFNKEELLHYFLGDMPILVTKENEVINYDLVFYREPPYLLRVYAD